MLRSVGHAVFRMEDDTLYSGQVEPCLVFLGCLVVERFALPASAGGASEDGASAAGAWTLFRRLVACCYVVAFLSLRGQIVGLAGERGLYPARAMLRRARRDFPVPERWARFPALFLWCDCSDGALRGACALGAACAVATERSPAWFGACWACWTALGAAAPQVLGFPWDCLLAEVGFACALLLPPAGAPASPAAAFFFRCLAARLLLGMGKLKFASGWRRHGDYLRHFMAWQPLPTPLAKAVHGLGAPDAAWTAALYAMFVAEVAVPACFVSRSAARRRVAAVVSVALQGGIQATGNFGWFNVLTAALCVPIYAADGGGGGGGEVAAAALGALGAVAFCHNSYSTGCWAFELRTGDLPDALRGPLDALLACFRYLAPLKIANGYGVFTQAPPRGCDRGARRVLRVAARRGDDVPWEPIVQRYNPMTGPGRLDVFAPLMPRVDHLLYYEAMEIPLSETTRLNPYFTSGLLHRLVQRLMEREPAVVGLFASVPDGPIARVRVTRSWARFGDACWRDAATPSGATAVVDDFVAAPPDAALPPAPTHVPRLADVCARGFWGRRAAAARRSRRGDDDDGRDAAPPGRAAFTHGSVTRG